MPITDRQAAANRRRYKARERLNALIASLKDQNRRLRATLGRLLREKVLQGNPHGW